MVRTLGIIDCVSSQPLHNRRFAGQSLLQWISRRCSDSQLLDRLVVLTNHRESVEHLVLSDIKIFTSLGSDPLACFSAAVNEFQPQEVIRVRLDHPFTDPELIDQLIISARAKPQCDYISYCTNDGRPTVQSQIGVFAEWCKAKAIQAAEQEATDLIDRHQPTHFVYTHPERFTLSFIPAPVPLDRDDLRLCVHDEEDWDNAETIVDALGSNELAWQSVADLLHQHPAMRARMAILNRADTAS